MLALGLVVAACTDSNGDTAGSSDQTSTTAEDGLSIVVPPDENGEFPPGMIVSCPSGPSFPVSALDEVDVIDSSDPAGMLAAIAPFLTSGEGEFWPQEDWRLVHQESDQATLVTTFEGQLAFMFLSRQDGQWAWSGSSMSGDRCDLQYTTPEGLNTVEWRLDPSAAVPGPDSTSFQVLLRERECVSGQEIGGRLRGPQVVITETEVLVAFATEPPRGDAFNCQGNPEMAFTVELDQTLGDRTIVEGMSIGLNLEDHLR